MRFLSTKLNNKLFVLGLLILLSVIILGLSCYLIYVSNNQEECFCDEFENILVTPDDSTSEDVDAKENKPLYVEVKGAVLNPGVFAVSDENIINDVIAMAGGFTDNAYTANINLSKRVTDELVIYVYTDSEYQKNNSNDNSSKKEDNSYTIDEYIDSSVSIITSSSSDNVSNSSESGSLININTASSEQLTTLPGIGDAKANNIIAYRTEVGYFKTIEELKNVNGIGDATFEQLKSLITV